MTASLSSAAPWWRPNAAGETALLGLDHVDRGCGGMAAKLARCGADIARQ